MSDNPLEEIAYIRAMWNGEDGLLEAFHVPNRYAFHPDERVRAAYHIGICRAARTRAAQEGYIV